MTRRRPRPADSELVPLRPRTLSALGPTKGTTIDTQVQARTTLELRRSATWLQLASFCAVGATGYVVNLAVYSTLVAAALPFGVAAVCSFAVAVANNYALNRVVTFRKQRAGLVRQGARYLTVSVTALLANLGVLVLLVHAGLEEVPAQAAAIVVVTPVSFLGNKLWSFGGR